MNVNPPDRDRAVGPWRRSSTRRFRLDGYRLTIPSLSLLLFASWAVAFGQSPSSDKRAEHRERVYTDPTWDKRPEYGKRGYTELTGADAARFLISNSVIVPEEKAGVAGAVMDTPKKIYYFPDAHTIYQCSPALEGVCVVGSWSVGDNGICLDIGACEPFSVFRSPEWQDWERNYGKLGIYLTYDHYEAEIVKGNWTNGPSFTTRVSASHIELNRADYAGEVAESAQLHMPDGQVIIRGQRALSLLIGNTFLSSKAEADLQEKPNDFCPQGGGLFYSPDGFVVTFSCDGSGHLWSIYITRWRTVAGLLCRDDVDAPQELGCGQAIVTAVPAQDSSAPGKMHVVDWNGSFTAIQDSPIGYSGNLFNFRFGQRDK